MLKKLIPTVAVSLFAVSAFAATTPTFADLDTDKDGVLAQAEVEVVGIDKKMFEKADIDMNGKLDEAEYTKLVEELTQPAADAQPAAEQPAAQ